MEILKRPFKDLPGIGEGEWVTGTISMSVTREQLQDLDKLTGIDPIGMIENVIANEVYQSLSKVISTTARDKKPIEIKWQNNSAYWLSDLLSKCKPLFMITNVAIGAGLQDMEQFEVKKLETTFNNNGSIYELGKFDGVSVYADPMMLWTEKELAIVENNFLEYEVDEEAVKLVTVGTEAPKITLDFKYKINGVNSKLYTINEFDF